MGGPVSNQTSPTRGILLLKDTQLSAGGIHAYAYI